MTAPTAVEELREALLGAADPDRAPAMTAYMKDQFPFLGIGAKERRAAARPFISSHRDATPTQLMTSAELLWAAPEREFQYVGADLLRRWAGHLVAGQLDDVEVLISTKSWWDTVDALAAHVVGPMVERHDLAATMDRWIHGDLWVARSAILHQLNYKTRTDEDRLFRYCDLRAADGEFFLRKAIGWALRQYARVAPDAVRNYVDARRDSLSALSIREATKHL